MPTKAAALTAQAQRPSRCTPCVPPAHAIWLKNPVPPSARRSWRKVADLGMIPVKRGWRRSKTLRPDRPLALGADLPDAAWPRSGRAPRSASSAGLVSAKPAIVISLRYPVEYTLASLDFRDHLKSRLTTVRASAPRRVHSTRPPVADPGQSRSMRRVAWSMVRLRHRIRVRSPGFSDNRVSTSPVTIGWDGVPAPIDRGRPRAP